MAQGSAAEVLGALELADAWGWEIESQPARALLDRVRGLVWGRTRRDGAARTPSKRGVGDMEGVAGRKATFAPSVVPLAAVKGKERPGAD